MAIYEYQCEDCGHQFEQFRKITDDSLPDCEACNSPNVRKMISQTSFILKGSGWYVTDYNRKGATASHSHATNGETPSAEAAPPPDKKPDTDSAPQKSAPQKQEKTE